MRAHRVWSVVGIALAIALGSAGAGWAADVAATAHVAGDALDLQNARFTLAVGSITAKGRIPFGAEPAQFNASWRDVDATAITTALAGRVAVAPAGALSGALNATGPLTQLSKWAADVVLRADGGTTRRGRLAIPGETRLQLADGRWRIESHHRADGIVPIALVAGGELDGTTIGNSTVAGRLDAAHALFENKDFTTAAAEFGTVATAYPGTGAGSLAAL